jgi:hypothetical protein
LSVVEIAKGARIAACPPSARVNKDEAVADWHAWKTDHE